MSPVELADELTKAWRAGYEWATSVHVIVTRPPWPEPWKDYTETRLSALRSQSQPDSSGGGGDLTTDEQIDIRYLEELADEYKDSYKPRAAALLDIAGTLRRLTLQVKEGRDALFPATRKEVRDGITVNVSSDAEWNLRAALEDLTNSNGNDEVTRNTIARVADQLAAARSALSKPKAQEHE